MNIKCEDVVAKLAGEFDKLDVTDFRRLLFLGADCVGAFSTIIDNLAGGISLIELRDTPRVLYFNKSHINKFGGMKEEYMQYADDITKISTPDYAKEFMSLISKAAKEENGSFSFTFPAYFSGENIGWYNTKAIKVPYSQSEYPVFLALTTNITELKENEQKLTVAKEAYRILMQTINAVLFEYKPYEDVMSITYNLPENKSTRTIEHYTAFLEKTPLIHPDHIENFKNAMLLAMQRPIHGSIEYLSKIASDEYQWYLTYYTSIFNNDNELVSIVGRIHNINDLVLERETLYHQAVTDPLTGLLNKVALQNEVDAWLEANADCSSHLFIIDIDDFKSINDKYGHTYGDKVLKGFSACMQETFEHPHILGRFGGDEFVIFAVDLTEEDITIRSYELLELINGMFREDGLRVQCSIGIAKCDEKATNFDELFKRADAAMYAAKRKGKNTFCFFEEPNL